MSLNRSRKTTTMLFRRVLEANPELKGQDLLLECRAVEEFTLLVAQDLRDHPIKLQGLERA